MKRGFTPFVAAVAASLLFLGAVRTLGRSSSGSLQPFAASENSFGFALLKVADRGRESSNTFISPLSLSQAVAMLYIGAAGETRAQIADAMRYDAHPGLAVQSDSRELAAGLARADAGVDLSVANALWANSNIRFKAAFRQSCLRSFDARVTTLPFADPSSADAINSWVSRHTHGKIPTIVSAGAIRDAGAVLTDAVYFHGRWSKPFDPSRTRPGEFHLTAGTKPIAMMTATERLAVLQTAQFQAVRIPYGTGRLGMVIVLPRSGVSVGRLASLLNATTWNGWMKSLSLRQTQLALPRFHVRYSANLDQEFRALGVEDAFDPRRANLGPMSSTPMYVSEIVHKTTLDVDEEGTVATAATGIVAVPLAAIRPPRHPVVIRVDRPFLCAIQDGDTGALLFVGIIKDPQTQTGG